MFAGVSVKSQSELPIGKGQARGPRPVRGGGPRRRALCVSL